MMNMKLMGISYHGEKYYCQHIGNKIYVRDCEFVKVEINNRLLYMLTGNIKTSRGLKIQRGIIELGTINFMVREFGYLLIETCDISNYNLLSASNKFLCNNFTYNSKRYYLISID